MFIDNVFYCRKCLKFILIVNEYLFVEKCKSYREFEFVIIFKLCRILVFVVLMFGGIKLFLKVNLVNM